MAYMLDCYLRLAWYCRRLKAGMAVIIETQHVLEQKSMECWGWRPVRIGKFSLNPKGIPARSKTS